MKFRSFFLMAFAFALFGAGAARAAEVKVVASLPSLASLASAVGGKHTSVETLAAPGEDPHFVDARPDLILKLNRADLLIANGLELEIGWLPKLQDSARNPKILSGARGYLDASKLVGLLEIPSGKIDRSMGDLHPGGNPHFLYDPRAAALIARGIGTRLAELDPAHAADYRANAEQLAGQLTRFAQEQRQKFAALKPEQRRVVSYHKSLAYLFDWLGLQEVATLEPKPGISPSPDHVARVVGTMRSSGVKTVIQEEFYPSNTSQNVARLVGGKVVIIHGGARFRDGESYLTHITEIAREVYSALTR